MIPFISRELSQLSFNERVLDETKKPETLPLDKLKFIGITASNLDEFFMLRVAYLNDRSRYNFPDYAGLTAAEQLEIVLHRVRSFQRKQATILYDILAELEEQASRIQIDLQAELQTETKGGSEINAKV